MNNNKQNNQPTRLTEQALSKLIKGYIKEALSDEAITWPSTYWTEDDVDDYRRMSDSERSAVDRQQIEVRKNDDEVFRNRVRVPVQGDNEEIEVKQEAFAESVTRKVMKSLRESINGKNNAKSRLI